jgi:hypothetical protein
MGGKSVIAVTDICDQLAAGYGRGPQGAETKHAKPGQLRSRQFSHVTDARDPCHCISVHSTEKSAVSRPMFTEEDALMGSTPFFQGLSISSVGARPSHQPSAPRH